MSQASSPTDALQGWDPRRRAALEEVWEQFARAGAKGLSLSEELIAERRREAATETSTPTEPETGTQSPDEAAGTGAAPRHRDAP